MITLRMTDAQFQSARDYLFGGSTEQLVFLFCSWDSSALLTAISCQEMYFVPRHGFLHQSKYHIHLTDKARQYVIKRAWDQDFCVIEFHSHRNQRIHASFSLSDLSGFDDFVPHVRWRLQYRPYGALVFTANDFDALIWSNRANNPKALDVLRLDSNELLPTNYTYNKLRKSKHG